MRFEPAVREGLGELVTDERPAEHHRHLGLGDAGDHPLRLVEVLEVEEVRRAVGARAAQRIRPAARRDQEPVIPKVAARVGMNDLLLEVHLPGRRLEPQVDAVLLVPLHVADVHALLEENPTEVAREGDAVVEGVRLVVDHDDLACDVQLAQLLGAVCPGCAVPNDHEAGGIRAQLVLLFARCSLLCRNAAQVARAACSRSEVLPLLA